MSRSASASSFVIAALVAVMLPLVSCGPGAGSDAPAGAVSLPAVPTPDAIARLVPDDAIAFVRLSSLDACEEFLRRAVRPFDAREADTLDIDELLRETLVPGDMRAVDRTRPLGIAVSVDREELVPLLTVIVPVVDRAAFETSVSLLETAEDGDYLGASEVPGYAARAEPHALAGYLPGGPLALHIDLETLIGAYRSKIDLLVAGSFNMIRSSMPGDGAQAEKMAGMIDAYEDGVKAVLDSAERFEFGTSMDGTQLDVVADFWAIGGSPLGTLGSDEPTDIVALADTVGYDDAMVFLAGMDMADLARRFEHLTATMIQMVPEPMQDWMAETMEDWEDVYAAMGSGLAGSVRFGEGGMRMAQVLRPADVDALFDLYRRMYASEEWLENGLILEPAQETSKDGLRVLSLRMDLTRLAMEAGGQFPFSPAGGATAPEVDDAELRELLERMYGTGGMALHVASKADRLTVVMGGDDAWAEAAIARMGGGSAVPTDIAAELDRVGRMNPCLVARVDVGGMIGEMIALMRTVLPEDANTIGPVPPASMSFSVGVAGRTWKGHASVDLEAMGKALKAISDS